MKLPKLKLQPKLLLLFVIVSAIPLIVTNILWFNASRAQIQKSTANTLILTASDISHQIEAYLQNKGIALIIHSQTDSVLNAQIDKATDELQTFLFQDEDIQEITVLNPQGKEIIHLSRNKIYHQNELLDQSSSNAFITTTTGEKEAYVSQAYIDTSGDPNFYIAIPIVKLDQAHNLQELASFKTETKDLPVKGVLKVNYKLSDLWKNIEQIKIGNSGYVFLVNGQGEIIAHPKSELAKQRRVVKNLSEVNKFLADKNNGDKETGNNDGESNLSNNEFGISSLMTHLKVPTTDWGVIAQIPLSDTLADVQQAAVFAYLIALLIIGIVIVIGYWLSIEVVNPIQKLRQGSQKVGSGDLSYRISINSGDEIEDLGNSFNSMAANLQNLFQKSEDQKKSLENTTTLLIKRDAELRNTMEELEKEKTVVTGERNKLVVMLSGISDSVIALDLKHHIIVFNKAAETLTGLKEEEVSGKPFNNFIQLFNDDEQISVNALCPPNLNNFEGVVYSNKSIKLVGINKKEVYVNLISGQIREGNDLDFGCILTLHDVTEEKSLEDMKLDFVSMAAHELRTPLTSLRGYTYIMMRDYKEKLDEQANKILGRIGISTQRLVGLVENLLNVTRIERGTLNIHQEPTNWVDNIKEVMAEISDQAKDKNIELEFKDPSTPLPLINIDKLRINEVLTNLLANAINYTQPGGKITIETKQVENDVVTSVKDTGEGIPPEAFARLFTKFFRVSGKLEQGSKGTGLGLYISKSIVEMHKGKIWAESEGLTKGSTFSFSLPIDNSKPKEDGKLIE